MSLCSLAVIFSAINFLKTELEDINMKLLIFITTLSMTISASAIQYVKGSGKIKAEDFDQCTNKVYRKSGQDELSPENRRQAIKEALVGKAINDLGAAKKYLADHSDACTYGADSEGF